MDWTDAADLDIAALEAQNVVASSSTMRTAAEKEMDYYHAASGAMRCKEEMDDHQFQGWASSIGENDVPP